VDRVVAIVGRTHEKVVKWFREYLEGREEKGESEDEGKSD